VLSVNFEWLVPSSFPKTMRFPTHSALVRSKALPSAVLLLVLFAAGCASVPSRPAPPDPTSPAAEFLRQAGQSSRDPGRDIGLSLSAAESALELASDTTLPSATRTRATEIYNAAVARCVAAWQTVPHQAAQTFPGATTSYRLRVPTRGQTALKDPALFTKLVDATTVSRRHLPSENIRAGVGAPLVGVINPPNTKDPNRMPSGYTEPLTAVVRFAQARQGSTPVDLEFFDPRQRSTLTLDGATFPLRADFTAPLAYFPALNKMLFGIVAMLRSDRADQKAGIYFLEPYDPDKIPVLFVHGLMSSPHAWIEFVNELNADPYFRRHYQPWVLFYPSGGPIAGNALRLRRYLAEIAERYPLKRNLVIIGHSMGGLLTKMQVTDSGDQLWNTIFGARADTVRAMLPKKSLVKEALHFQANPHANRVIFIATPHLGSRLATLRISSLAGSLIRLPAAALREFNPTTRSILHEVAPSLHSLPSSIVGLSPQSPLLKGANQLPIKVPYHSIIGNRGQNNKPLEKTSDGIVPYWSSHREGAESELIVPTGHDAFDHPDSVKEVLRILKLRR
jgi:hypothetical protein